MVDGVCEVSLLCPMITKRHSLWSASSSTETMLSPTSEVPSSLIVRVVQLPAAKLRIVVVSRTMDEATNLMCVSTGYRRSY